MMPVAFDPDRVAYAEAHGWRAYYERRWLRLLGLLIDLNRAQFQIPFPFSWLAAYYVVRASIAFAPAAHDLAQVRAELTRFYRLARRYSGRRFEPAAAADAELTYWDVHRRLAGRPDKAEFLQAMIALHSLVFELPPAQARESAEWRVAANNRVDAITSRASPNPEADWQLLEAELRACYRSVNRAQPAA